MLKLEATHILLGQTVTTKAEAIALLADKLTEAGLVAADYVDGMLAREAQQATYLGSGIAIPHGTTDTRHLVNRTGVMVAQFPHGIAWDEGQIAYIAIGIAAKSDEHLAILRQLTHVLGDEQAAAQLQGATDAETIIHILTGATAAKAVQYLTLADFPAEDRDQLLLGAAARAKSAGWGDAAMVSILLASEPAYLGEGIWLARAQAAQSGWVLATPSHALSSGERPVSALLLLCAADGGYLPQLENLAKLADADQLATLVGSDGLAMLQAGPASGLAETFTILNPHGLHARPGAMLVKVAKEYEADIRVANLDGSGEAVSAKSLMKVIGLGVKCGHRLAFRAEGADAEAALKGIGVAIAAGLGEGTH
ncbi:fused PTS fructose transporter subunit IIA/HPr protein [Aeromonas cavernicola]|uniref:Multiphosphoryl transfer protein n=1 Tax=Aeromonas cavernicola TaxID=1006623 RepID=A0A2H9U9U5_9GAMM|nr:fused PTS fructose transporter subunit IIA/HPr protein [Aeromonas cavernicola]PJG60792.1 bifunctional PTS fructose transporter subunit IIA/HPr protein [Aeromonas cavernicola]